MQKPKYLIRPEDLMIFELDDSNDCYRPFEDSINENRPNAQKHFTYENLTRGYDFYPITEEQIAEHKIKSNEWYEYFAWRSRPDGHGGTKGGTREEFEKYKSRK